MLTSGGDAGASNSQDRSHSAAGTGDTWDVDVDTAVDNGLFAGGLATQVGGTATRLSAGAGADHDKKIRCSLHFVLLASLLFESKGKGI